MLATIAHLGRGNRKNSREGEGVVVLPVLVATVGAGGASLGSVRAVVVERGNSNTHGSQCGREEEEIS